MAVQAFSPLVLRNAAGTVQWRVQGVVVDRSTDGGATWSRVYTAPRPLTAGAVAADDTVWLAGQGGLIVRSTAAGWALAPAPEVVDLTGVSQVTRLGATVRTSNGRSFRTEDGGKTWVQGN
jgi:photosystem II stability/assembly factor-like uncharacterized protein